MGIKGIESKAGFDIVEMIWYRDLELMPEGKYHRPPLLDGYLSEGDETRLFVCQHKYHLSLLQQRNILSCPHSSRRHDGHSSIAIASHLIHPPHPPHPSSPSSPSTPITDTSNHPPPMIPRAQGGAESGHGTPCRLLIFNCPAPAMRRRASATSILGVAPRDTPAQLQCSHRLESSSSLRLLDPVCWRSPQSKTLSQTDPLFIYSSPFSLLGFPLSFSLFTTLHGPLSQITSSLPTVSAVRGRSSPTAPPRT